MDNAAQIDLHTASVMLKSKIIQFHYSNNLLHSAYFRYDLPENKRRSRADAGIVPRDCVPTLLGPSLLHTYR